MSKILAAQVELADRLIAEQPQLEAVVREEGARLMLAVTLQEALEQSIEGSDLAHIERSMLEQQTGLSAHEIYGLAHADRRIPFVFEHFYRVISATGFALGLVPSTKAMAA